MKKTDKISYRQKTQKELQKDLFDLKKSLIEAKAKFTTGNLTDTSVFTKIKRQIALVLNFLSQNNEK